MKKVIHLIKDSEEGYVIIATILILAMVTVIASMAINTSTTEVQISTNALLYQKTFYAAEAGLEHSLKLLEGFFVANNATKVKTGATADWNFALVGSNVNPSLKSHRLRNPNTMLRSSHQDRLTYQRNIQHSQTGPPKLRHIRFPSSRSLFPLRLGLAYA